MEREREMIENFIYKNIHIYKNKYPLQNEMNEYIYIYIYNFKGWKLVLGLNLTG